MGFLGLGKKNNEQNGPEPVSEKPFLMRYLETDPEARTALGSGHRGSTLVYSIVPHYGFVVEAYSIRDARDPETEILIVDKIREDFYKLRQ